MCGLGQGEPGGGVGGEVEEEDGGWTAARTGNGTGVEDARGTLPFIVRFVGVAEENIIQGAGGDGLREAAAVIAVHHKAAFFRHHKLKVFAAGDAGGLGMEGGEVAKHPVAIADGHMGAQAVLLAGRGKQVHDIFAGVAAMHEVPRAVAQEQIQRAASFRQVVMRVGEQAQFHAASVSLCGCRGKPQAACFGLFRGGWRAIVRPHHDGTQPFF